VAAYSNRSIARRERGELADALADVNQVIALNPKHARAYANRGLVRLLQWRDVEAEQDFATCYGLEPRCRETLAPLIREAKAKRAKK
jgi:tetratricopeptide (TPR) repeat protein